MVFDKEAAAMKQADDQLLIEEPLFQGFWREARLLPQIGYPTTTQTGRGKQYDTLAFDGGPLEFHDNGNCRRFINL